MHKTTNHVFSQFIRLQPWAFSLSLAGLLTLGSCTPPATQKPPMPTAPSSSPIWLDNVPNLLSSTPPKKNNLHFGLGDFKTQALILCGWTTEEAQASYGGANSCYSAGGTPKWTTITSGPMVGADGYCHTYAGCEYSSGGGGGGNSNENPDNDNCEGKCDGAGAAPFDLLMVHNNLPPNGLKPLGDAVQSQVTISPADVNDAYDSARLVINDRDNKGWKLELFKPNGKRIYEESGLGNSVAGWDGLDDNQALSNGIYRAKLTQIEDPGIVLERTVRVDNEKPVISNIRVQEEPSANRYTVKAKLKEAGNGTFQSGLNPAKTKLFFDDGVDRDDANKDYNADTGEYSVTFSDLDKYRIAKVQSQLQNGYDFPFELQIADYAGNQASNRGSGPDGPLRIQVSDPYFSPNADGVKDNLNFKVIAETSEPYLVAIKRNGIAVKTWTGLTGEQNLSWNGNFMFTDNLQADGSYRIVAMTERQRDRVRDAQMVVLDNAAPDLIKATLRKSQGQDQLVFQLKDQGAGVDFSQSQVFFSNKDGQALPLQGTGQSLNNQWIYSFNALTPAQRKEIKNQQTKVGIRIADKVANKKTISPVPLTNQCDSGKNIGIQIEGLNIGSAGELTLTGLIEGVDENFSSSDLQLDFDRFLLPLEQTIVLDSVPNQPDKRRFTAIVSSYDPTFFPANAALDEIKVRASIAVSDSDCIQLASGTRTIEDNFQTAADITDRCVTGTGKYCLKVETHATCNGSAGSLKLLDCQAKAALINKWPGFIKALNEMYQSPWYFDGLTPIEERMRVLGTSETILVTLTPPESIYAEQMSFAAIKPEKPIQISNAGALGLVFIRMPQFALPMFGSLGLLSNEELSKHITRVYIGGIGYAVLAMQIERAGSFFDDTIDTSVVLKQAADKLRRSIINDTSRPAIERLECQEKDPIKTSQRRPTHHVVAEHAGKMRDALQKLKNCGIDVNDSPNGVCLDDSFHKGLHRDDTYYNPINNEIVRLSKLPEACDEIKGYLRRVIEALRNGRKDFNGL